MLPAVSPPPRTASAYSPDILIGAVICIFAGIAAFAFIKSGLVPVFHFFQDQFSPAIMQACGYGYVQPSPVPTSMEAFLGLNASTFSCNDIPAGTGHVAPNVFQAASRYLLVTVSLWWRVFGISWGSLTSLYVLLFSISAGAAYGLFRSVAGRPIAAAATLVFVASPPQLYNLPHLRDYCKAPFMLIALALIAHLLCTRPSPRRRAWIATAAGLTLGLGLGFRVDLLIMAPVFSALLLIHPGEKPRDFVPRGIALACFLASLLLSGGPILHELGGGSNLPHIVALGLMGEFDSRLGLGPAFYGLGYHYLDVFAQATINVFAQLSGHAGSVIEYPSRQYDAAGMEYVIAVYRQFPADAAIRFLAAVWQILRLPISAPITFEDLYRFYDSPVWLTNLVHLKVWDWLLGAAVLLAASLIAKRSVSLMLIAAAVIVYISGYPALQFGVRHYFYLEVVGLWIFALCLQQIVIAVRQFDGAELSARQFRSWLRPIAWSIGVIVVLPQLLLFGLRTYQAQALLPLFTAYEQAPARHTVVDDVDGRDNWRLYRISPENDPPALPTPDSFRMRAWILTLDGRKCDRTAVRIRPRYGAVSGPYDFGEQRWVSVDSHTRIVIPAFYRSGATRLEGFEMPASEAACLVDVAWMDGVPPSPIPMTITFSDHWQTQPRFRTFR